MRKATGIKQKYSQTMDAYVSYELPSRKLTNGKVATPILWKAGWNLLNMGNFLSNTHSLTFRTHEEAAYVARKCNPLKHVTKGNPRPPFNREETEKSKKRSFLSNLILKHTTVYPTLATLLLTFCMSRSVLTNFFDDDN